MVRYSVFEKGNETILRGGSVRSMLALAYLKDLFDFLKEVLFCVYLPVRDSDGGGRYAPQKRKTTEVLARPFPINLENTANQRPTTL